jgi:hypothetical protein
MALDFVHRLNARMNLVPEPRKGITIVPSPVLRMVETVHQGLTVNDQLDLGPRTGMEVGQQEPEVLRHNRRAGMASRDAHAGCQCSAVRGVLYRSRPGLCNFGVIHVFAQPIRVDGSLVIPTQV